MSKFFINRPIVAIVISIVMVILGIITIISLPVAQFPNIGAKSLSNFREEDLKAASIPPAPARMKAVKNRPG